MVKRASRQWLIAFGLLGFGVTSLLTSPILPLYDGIGFPDEPYRYLVAPPGTQPTAPATGAQGISPIKNGSNTDVFQVATPETAPQAMVVIVSGHLMVTARAGGSDSVPEIAQVTVTPITPTTLPTDGTLVGNAYAFGVDVNGARAYLDRGDIAQNAQYISMRLPQANVDKRDNAPQPLIEYRAPGSKTWLRLTTEQTGTDIYQAPVTDFGDYAVVIPKAAPQGQAQVQTRQPSSKLPVVATVALVTVSVATVALSIARRAVKRRHTDDKKSR